MLWVLAAVIGVLLIGYALWSYRRPGKTRRRGTVSPAEIERARANGQERLYNDYLPGRDKHS